MTDLRGSALVLAPPTGYTHTQEGLFGIWLERAGAGIWGAAPALDPGVRDPPWARLSLGAAVHPEPGKAIGRSWRAGAGGAAGGEEVVELGRWRVHAERSGALGSEGWEPVTGVQSNAVRLSRAAAPGYFRLRSPGAPRSTRRLSAGTGSALGSLR
ncbi:MAG: hypothetical protein HS113_20450 [Verrucomicrobiales bacterium]|nr:hypothetical protein [Verrucomicrobiales bacterium]